MTITPTGNVFPGYCAIGDHFADLTEYLVVEKQHLVYLCAECGRWSFLFRRARAVWKGGTNAIEPTFRGWQNRDGVIDNGLKRALKNRRG